MACKSRSLISPCGVSEPVPQESARSFYAGTGGCNHNPAGTSGWPRCSGCISSCSASPYWISKDSSASSYAKSKLSLLLPLSLMSDHVHTLCCFLLPSHSSVSLPQEDEFEISAGEAAFPAHKLELVPPSPALKTPYMSPTSIGQMFNSKAALAGVTSMPSLDVLQEQEEMESSGVFWNGGNDLAEGIALCPFLDCYLRSSRSCCDLPCNDHLN